MTGEPGPADDELLAGAGRALADAVDGELDAWIASCVHRWLPAGRVEPAVLAEAVAAARAEVMGPLRDLLAADVDRQPMNPLALLRAATRFPTAVLARAEAPTPVRDGHQKRLFPDDHWNLVPNNFADIGPATGEAGVRWGAAKAWVHRRRHLGRPSGPSGGGPA